MSINWRDHIESNPDVLKGKPCIKGQRIPVSLILGYLSDGKGQKEIIEEFSSVTPVQIFACLDYARDLAEYELAA